MNLRYVQRIALFALLAGCAPDGFVVVDAGPDSAPLEDASRDVAQGDTACAPNATCDDLNACTANDRCSPEGECIGQRLVCNVATDRCDGHTLLHETHTGECHPERGCLVEVEREECPYGCAEGACLPCRPMAWAQETLVIDVGEGPEAQSIDFVVDGAGGEHVTYLTHTFSDEGPIHTALFYAYRRSPEEDWTHERLAPFTSGLGRPTLQVAREQPTVFVRELRTVDRLPREALLRYARNGLGEWVRTELPDLMPRTGFGFTLDDDGEAHLVRRDNLQVRHVFFESPSWLDEVIGPYRSSINRITMAYDAEGNLHVVWSDNGLVHAVLEEGGSWTVQDLDIGRHISAEDLSMAVDDSGNVHILSHAVADEHLYYTFVRDGAVTVDRELSDIRRLGDANALYVDDHGGIHIAYRDIGDFAVFYAYAASPTAAFLESEISSANGFSLSIHANAIGDVRVAMLDVDDLARRYSYYAMRQCPE